MRRTIEGLSEQPGHKAGCANRHAHSENNPCEHSLRLAFTKGEHESAHNDRDEAQTLGNGSCESGLEGVHRLLPRRLLVKRRTCDKGSQYQERTWVDRQSFVLTPRFEPTFRARFNVPHHCLLKEKK